MASKLPFLAIEVIELIPTFTEPTDLRSLRLVCRDFNKKTLHHFGLTNFATIQSDFSRKSLQRLQKISELEHLSVYVQCLHIKHLDQGKLGQEFSWSHHPSGSLADELNGADLLRDIFSQRLLKCRSFHIYALDEYEPRQETDCIIPSDAVGLILSIVAKTDLALKPFTIHSNHDGNGRLDTPRLRITLILTPEFVKAWAHIRELALDYAITSDQFDWVLHLISLANRLRKLSLGFHHGDSAFMERLSILQQLNMLEELSLRSASMTEDVMTTLLLKNRDTLHTLSLGHTTIGHGGQWSKVLAKLKDRLPHLQHLLLLWLKQDANDASSRVSFSKMTRFPAVTKSEEYGPNDRLKSDSHRIESVQKPIKLRYWGGGNNIVGVEYHGLQIDPVLSAFADAVESLKRLDDRGYGSSTNANIRPMTLIYTLHTVWRFSAVSNTHSAICPCCL
ncbi:MAG: hypothetical protein Q9201_007077 [Fulgogasparrea decipioides]